MQTVGLSSIETFHCCKCGRPASFHSPIGDLCPTDALIGAALHDWIPTHIHHSLLHEGDQDAD
ncbi:MAG: hypothetical protein ACLFRT_12080 [Actinomycetota bacterium]